MQTSVNQISSIKNRRDYDTSHPYLILFALWLMMFSASSQVMIMAPILPEIGSQLNIPEAVQGTLVTSYAVFAGICALIIGPISDKIGRRPILIAGTGAMALVLFLHIVAFDYYSMLSVRAAGGMAGGMLTGVSAAYIGDYFPSEKRGWANGWVMTGIAAGQILGIPLGTVLAEWHGIYAPFVFFAIPMALACVVTILAVPQPSVRRMNERLTIKRAVSIYVEMLTTPHTAAACASYAMMFLGIAFYVIYLPTWLKSVFGVSGNEIASLFMIGGVASVLIGPQAGKLSDRIGRKSLILWSCVGLSVLMAATTYIMTSFWIAYVLFFLAMILVASRMGPFQALISEIIPDERRGSMMSLSIAIGQVALGVGSAISGFAYTTYGYVSSTMLGAVSMLAMGLLVWIWIEEPQADVIADSA